MCARFSNLRVELRERLEFPNGKVGSPKLLEERFGDVSPEERGRLSRLVMGALPKGQREVTTDWISKRAKKDKVDPAVAELFVFYAVGHHATSEGTSIEKMVGAIVAQKSAAGVFLPANA
jgi:hypothetical protein